MNTTLQHIAKPASKEKRQKTKLPPQAALFAKQMGLDLTGLEAEVRVSFLTYCVFLNAIARLRIFGIS